MPARVITNNVIRRGKSSSHAVPALGGVCETVSQQQARGVSDGPTGPGPGEPDPVDIDEARLPCRSH